MRPPFSGLLRRGEQLLAAGEVELGIVTGPLAMPSELLALLSPLISIVLFVRLDGDIAKLLGVVLPPVGTILLARYVFRRWHRPRQWVGVTTRRVLLWRLPGRIRREARVEEIPAGSITAVELNQDDWDRRRGTHHVILHIGEQTRDLGRVEGAEQIQAAVLTAARAALDVAPAPPPVSDTARVDFVPPGSSPTTPTV